MKKVRIAIVGCGGMGSGHAIALASGSGKAIWNVDTLEQAKVPADEYTTDISKLIDLAGVCDVDSQRNQWATNMGIRVYDSYEAQLQDPHVDAILIATPNHLHKDMAIAAMRSGKHVLCEKPVTPTSEELEEILRVSQETGMIFYPRQNRRWDKDYLYAKKIFEEQIIGNIFDLECRITGSRGIPGDWRAKKAYGGGMMLDWGVHQLDRLLDMVKEPVKTVFCRLEYATHKECEDGFKMQLIFESGLKASVQVGTCHFVRHPNWYLAGEQGTAIIEDWNCNGKIVRLRSWKDADATPIVAGEGLTKTMAPRGDNSVETLPLPDLHYDRNELYANFAACIRGEAQQIVTGEQALRVIRLMEAAVHSHNTCAAVNFE